MDKGAAFQTTDVSESRCTDHIPQAFVLTGRNRCIADGEPENQTGSSGHAAVNHPSRP